MVTNDFVRSVQGWLGLVDFKKRCNPQNIWFDREIKTVVHFIIFKDGPMFSHINGKLLLRLFE